MKQVLSIAVQAITPPIVWNALQRLRRLPQRHVWREFGAMQTCAGAKPLLHGKFADLYKKYQPLDPFTGFNVNRYRLYNVCHFAHLCRQIPGDFVSAGVSWGVAPRMVFDFVDFPSLGKTLHLIDPFEGIVSSGPKINPNFNRDPEYVLRQYPPGAPVALHRERIPLRLPDNLSFVFSNTGDPSADADAIPIFYEGLSPGGIIITEQFANNSQYYEPVLSRLGITPLWLPSGQVVIQKQ